MLKEGEQKRNGYEWTFDTPCIDLLPALQRHRGHYQIVDVIRCGSDFERNLFIVLDSHQAIVLIALPQRPPLPAEPMRNHLCYWRLGADLRVVKFASIRVVIRLVRPVLAVESRVFSIFGKRFLPNLKWGLDPLLGARR